jgi:hypothetical protein
LDQWPERIVITIVGASTLTRDVEYPDVANGDHESCRKITGCGWKRFLVELNTIKDDGNTLTYEFNGMS